MKDSEKLQEIIDKTHLNVREFAFEIGLKNAQSLYNILKGEYNISRKIARMITDRFDEIEIDSIIDKQSEVQILKSINDKPNSDAVTKEQTHEMELKRQIKVLEQTVERLETELKLYRERESTYLRLLTSGLEKKPSY